MGWAMLVGVPRWVCPECGRSNQGHECAPAMVLEDYFATGPPFERPVFDVVAVGVGHHALGSRSTSSASAAASLLLGAERRAATRASTTAAGLAP